MTLEEKMETALWVAHSLFKRNKVSGSSANLSFLHDGIIFITASGTSFGRLSKNDFSQVDLQRGFVASDQPVPSKELPLHRTLYLNKPVEAVIHTHSFFSTLWSCFSHENEHDVIPSYTPYLRMKVGRIGLIPYAPPGSQELFALFDARVDGSDAFLLANHGPIVGGIDIADAFNKLEELEESARLAWHLRDTNVTFGY